MQQLRVLEIKVLNKYSQTSHSTLLNKALRWGSLFRQSEANSDIKQNAIFILNGLLLSEIQIWKEKCRVSGR